MGRGTALLAPFLLLVARAAVGTEAVPAALAAPPPPAAAAAPVPAGDWEARLLNVQGEVYVIPAAHPDSFYPAKTDEPLVTGDTIQTGADGACDIALEKDNLLHVENGTVFSLASLDRDHSSFNVTFGGVLGKFAGLAERGATAEFRTPTGWGGIRGTEIGIETVGGESHFAVFGEGKLAVRQGPGGDEVLVTANQEVTAAQGQPLPKPAELHYLQRRQQAMGELLKRHEAVRQTWKPAAAAERQAARSRLESSKPEKREKVERRLEKAQAKRTQEFHSEPRPAGHAAPRPERRERPRTERREERRTWPGPRTPSHRR